MGEDNPTAPKSLQANPVADSPLEKSLKAKPKTLGQRRRSLAEWTTLALSTLLLAAIVGLVLYDWQLNKHLPPAFQVELNEPFRLTAGRYYVPFTLHNTGGRIARKVQVIAELHLPDDSEETGEQQFDFLSGNERKKGSFVFEHDPQGGELIVRVASFGLP
jgi:uncharacterized protein (TIGR02588 family)